MLRHSLAAFACIATLTAPAEQDGLIRIDGEPRFPIGIYDFPEDDAAVVALAEAGINLVRCGGVADLDRARAHGLSGWVSLPMHTPLTAEGEQQIREIADHPALVVWEGPDELVWYFTAYSGLALDGTHERTGAWWEQTPKAVAYAREQAAKAMPNIHSWTARIREVDTRKRPIWFNEAFRSDAYYVRQYIDAIDITGCDLYPVKAAGRPVANVGAYTERYNQVGRGKPVWMVLQAFSWHEVKKEEALPAAYPTFAESRFMAWDAIAHGATGILYWGSRFTDNAAFMQAIFAVTRELDTFQPFLTAESVPGVTVTLVEAPFPELRRGVAHVARVYQDDALIVLINEDEVEHMGVEVRGLDAWNGRPLHLAYGDETITVSGGEVMTRLQPLEVKVFTTAPPPVEQPLTGRNFGADRPAGQE